MVFGILAGLNAQVLAADHAHVETCTMEPAETPCAHSRQDPHHGHHHPGEDHDGNDHHHHHDCCSHAQPLTVENHHLRQPGVPGSSLLGVRHEGEVPPEEPFLGSEKPPLI
jgi:hypothetical protein